MPSSIIAEKIDIEEGSKTRYWNRIHRVLLLDVYHAYEALLVVLLYQTS